MWNIGITVFMSFCAGSNICVCSGLVLVNFFSHVDHYFSVSLCVSVHFRLDTRQSDLDVVGCLSFVFLFKYFEALFWNAVKLLGNNVMLLKLAVKLY